MELEGKTAIVTGGASGLGAATARMLAKEGVKVGLFDLNDTAGIQIAEELGGVFAKVNVTNCGEVDAGFAQIREKLGQESILINCAGTGNACKTASRNKTNGEIRHFPIDDFARIIEINLIGTASVAAEDGQIGQASYSASKAGVVGMTLPIARDLAQEFIRVNTILPGIFDTPLLQGAPDNVKDALAASVPHPARLGNPDDYASLALEMCRNSYFNGEDVRLDGAIRMAQR